MTEEKDIQLTVEKDAQLMVEKDAQLMVPYIVHEAAQARRLRPL